MKFNLKLSLLFVLLYFVFPINIVFADEKFDTYSDIFYVVGDNAQTYVTHKVKLVNKLENLYATQYSIIIGSNKVSEVFVRDDFGKIEPQIENKDNYTEISVIFDHKIIGKNKERNITFNYSTPDFATIRGKVLEVSLPTVANANDFKALNILLKVPKQYKQPTDITPNYISNYLENNNNVFTFNKSVLTLGKGISASFGDKQLYDFKLRYTLQNTQDIKGKTEIAIPMDTSYQTILYNKIEPRPIDVIVDYDNNWLAQYIIEPKSTLQINVEGSVLLQIKPKDDWQIELTSDQYSQYTKYDQYWETTSPKIQKLKKLLNTPEKIYDYLINNFIYDFGRLTNNTQRLGAEYILDNPDNAICMEFTDAFITLVRALDIPARENNGFAFTSNDKLRPLSVNQDILHSWPEYYDKTKKQWIAVDPTWGNTTGGVDYFNKFDLEHFTFVKHGLESTYPITAGAYKIEGTEGKDVEVTIGSEFKPLVNSLIKISNFPSGISGLPVNGKFAVYNSGNVAEYNIPIKLNLIKNDHIIWSDKQIIKVLPPYANYEFDVNYLTNWKLESGDYQFQVLINNNLESVNFTLHRLLNPDILAILIGLFLGIKLWIIGYNWKIKKNKSLIKENKYEANSSKINQIG